MQRRKKHQYISRIKREIKTIEQEIKSKEIDSIEVLEVHPEFEYAILSFSGPIDSPYEGYWFRVKFEWPPEYPYCAPKCTLLDDIWNPYVDNKKHEICMDILNDQFSPILCTRLIVESIMSVLSQTKITQDHIGFINPDAAIQMKNNYPLFKKHAIKSCQKSSYKKKQIYTDNMRGLQEKHQIIASQNEIEQIKTQNLSSKKFNKKEKKITKRRMARKLVIRRQKLRLLKLQYGLGKVEQKENQQEQDENQ